MTKPEKTIKAIGEIVLRVKDMKVMREFYENILGLELLGDFESMLFFQIAPSYGGHIQALALFDEALPPDHRSRHFTEIKPQTTSLHHIAFAIDQADYMSEMERLQGLGYEVETMEHGWMHWRSLYVLDPEGNLVELVCYDESVK
jgi:catechol 2,3-dioxygenase-like lactoylglutathione lyase family enzyme